MFNDRDSDEYPENFEDDEIREQMEQIEAKFFESLEKDEDISIYLYLPFQFLTPKVKKVLDKYLMEQAYVNMFIRKDSSDVYHDGRVQIEVTNPEHRLKMLEKMIVYFAEKEEYEKCARIKEEINQLK